MGFSPELQCKLIRELKHECTVETMLGMIVDGAAEELHADACSIYLVNPDGEMATQRAATGYQAQFTNQAICRVVPAGDVSPQPEGGEKLGLASWILSTGQPFLACSPDELWAHPHHAGVFDDRQLNGDELLLQTFLGVPIRDSSDRVIGVVKAERRVSKEQTVEPFSIADQMLLVTVAQVASRCLDYCKLATSADPDTARDRWASDAIQEAASPEVKLEMARFKWALDAIKEAAATEGELDDFLVVVVKAAASAMNADSSAVFIVDENKHTLTQRAGVGALAPRVGIRSYPLYTREKISLMDPSVEQEKVGLTVWIAGMGEAFYAANTAELFKHPHRQGKYDGLNFKVGVTTCGAFYGVPLRVGGTITGVLKVENISRNGELDPRSFVKTVRQQFDILAQDIALAIVRFQTQSHLRYGFVERARKMTGEILQEGLTLEELVTKVVTETAELFNARACALFLKEGDKLVQKPWAAAGWAGNGPAVRTYQLVAPTAIKVKPLPEEKVGLTVWIAVTREKYTARSNLELTMHPHHKGTYDKDNFLPGEQCESFMGVPLIIGNQLIGVLKIETKMKGSEFTYFNEQDEWIFELIANSAAASIVNARLLDDLKRESEKRKCQLNAVVEILLAFRGKSNTEVLLESIARSVLDALGMDTCTIMQYNSHTTQFSAMATADRVRSGTNYTLPSAENAESYRYWFVGSGEPIVIMNAPADERTRGIAFIDNESIHTTLVVSPLLAAKEPVGLLFASYHNSQALTQDEQDAIALFANLVSAILQVANMREHLKRFKFLNWNSLVNTTWRHSMVQKVAAIRNYAYVLQQRMGAGYASDDYDFVVAKVSQIDTLAKQIIESLPKIPTFTDERERIHLAELLKDEAVLERPAFATGSTSVTISQDVNGLGDIEVLGYRKWLVDALEVLLQNARNAMPDGGLVTISGKIEGGFAEIRLTDTGVGIPEDIQRLIFKEPVPIKPGKTGMGLGSLLAAVMIEEQDGSIEIEQPGPAAGTTVLIKLPVASN